MHFCRQVNTKSVHITFFGPFNLVNSVHYYEAVCLMDFQLRFYCSLTDNNFIHLCGFPSLASTSNGPEIIANVCSCNATIVTDCIGFLHIVAGCYLYAFSFAIRNSFRRGL